MNKVIDRFTYAYVLILILLGVLAYFVTGRESITALIPSFFGIFTFLVYLVFFRMVKAKVLAIVLAVVAVVGLAATASGFPAVINMISGQAVERPSAEVTKSIMALVSFIWAAVYAIIGFKPTKPLER